MLKKNTYLTCQTDWILDENFINTRIRRSRFYRKPETNYTEASKTWNYHNNVGAQVGENEVADKTKNHTTPTITPRTDKSSFSCSSITEDEALDDDTDVGVIDGKNAKGLRNRRIS